jgi:Coenzyme F390 synthetase
VIPTVSLHPVADADAIARLIREDELQPADPAAVARLPSFLSKIRAAERLTGRPFAEMDATLQDALVLRRLQQMVATLQRNPAWAKRLGAAGFAGPLRDFDHWQSIPIADKDVMCDLYMGTRDGMVVPLSHGGFEIVASGGTSSGQPAETVYSLRELQDTYELAGEFMGRYQLAPYLRGNAPQWVITTLADYQMWSSGTMVGGVLQKIPGTNYIGAGPVSKDVYQHLMNYDGPKAFMGITASVAILPELGAGLTEVARRSLRVALYGSGVLTMRNREELKAAYPEIVILSYFAATQAETIGLQLDPDAPWLATVPGLHLVEIVDANGHWVAEGEEGELVVTRLHAHEAPLPRLRIGDRVIRRPALTDPGLTTLQFEFVGRSGDVIHLGDTQFSASRVFAGLGQGLRAMGIDLDRGAHEVQFVNNRHARTLTLLASVDQPDALQAQIAYLGPEGLHRLFGDALIRSLSLFNQGEANFQYLAKIGYRFELRFVRRGAPEIERTGVGKTPLLRDQHA